MLAETKYRTVDLPLYIKNVCKIKVSKGVPRQAEMALGGSG